MNPIITLLKPRLWSLKSKSLSEKNSKGWLLKLLLFGTVGIFFWGSVFGISLRVLGYFKSIEELGDLLAYKLLSMVLLTFFSLLIFSSIIMLLSKLYLSRDLSLVHSMPVSAHKIFIARWIESTVDSSWMVIVYTVPVFISYGIVYQAGPFFYSNIMLILLPLSIIASGISAALVMTAVVFIPASRMKSIFVFIGLCFFLILFFIFRFLRPERLVDPEVFANALIYLKALKAPAPPYLPSTWAFDSLKAALTGQIAQGWFHTTLLWSCAGFVLFFVIILADMMYFNGLSKTQTAAVRLFKYRGSGKHLFGFLPRPVIAFAKKEIKIFFRDQTQWTQIFLIGALVVIYIYNFRALPLEKSPIKTFYLQNLLSFLNMGLASFVLIAVTARFAFPAVSAEQEAIWIVKSVPISLKTYLWIKFFIYFLPLLALTELLIVATNMLLKVTPFMMVLSLLNILFIVPGVVSMGIGFGAAYPDFKSENPAQTVTSFGGLLFMMISAVYVGIVIILEAGPVYNIFMAGITKRALSNLEWIWIIGSFALVFILSILVITLPMRFGERRLSKILI
jgi:ABC-2 type transport system permease protein